MSGERHAVYFHFCCPVVADWFALENKHEGTSNAPAHKIREQDPNDELESPLMDEKQLTVIEQQRELDEGQCLNPK